MTPARAGPPENVPAGFVLKLPKNETYKVEQPAYLGDLARDRLGGEGKAELLFSLNLDELVRVPEGTKLKLPEDKTYEVPKEASLGAAAAAALGKEDKAQALYELNKEALEPKVTLPAGAALNVPQQTWPALVLFGLLVAFLVVVGLGWVLRQPPTPAPAGPSGDGPAPTANGP